MRAFAAAFLLVAAGPAGHAPMLLAPAPTLQPAGPVPLAPPTNPGPGPAPPSTGISPLLLGPGAETSGPSAPTMAFPDPIDQQKLQSYRTDLLDQQRALDRTGVSPADPRYRDIQQQLLQLNNASPR
ncbi:MAG TPA: hypothetical protein VGR91_18775 [Stellaceae bacterium]|nr:hypothetical protein [Stellaceae bacterium]